MTRATFSSRLQGDLSPNRLAVAVERARTGGRPFIDLTESNPTRAGFAYADDLLTPLADPRGLTYAPHPLGLRAARDAVAADFARRGVEVSPDHIALTSSTSEAYSLLFKVLCDPGDNVLVPRPSYPLFEHLTRLEGVTSTEYDLEHHGGWRIDVGSAARGVLDRTRALLVVSPNNPTGSFVKEDELDDLAALCRSKGMAIIADEVFADYTIDSETGLPRPAFSCVLRRSDVLTFSLGGLSKSVGLPQVKLGWIAVGGPESCRADALARLELACDTYLSVSTPVQIAAARLLQHGAAVRKQIQARVRRNHSVLVARGRLAPACRVLAAEGGWYAVVQVPSIGSEEELALSLLDQRGVLAHPGYFFDFQRGSHLIVSLLAMEASFDAGIERLFQHVEAGGPL